MFGLFKKSTDSATPETVPRPSWGERLKAGLARTRERLGGGRSAIFRRSKIDE